MVVFGATGATSFLDVIQKTGVGVLLLLLSFLITLNFRRRLGVFSMIVS